MKPFAEHLPVNPNESFRYSPFKCSHLSFRWHVHPEFELTLIRKGKGRRFIGDNISDYSGGDLVLIGGNLPHSWFSQHENRGAVIQFDQTFLGEKFLSLPEMQSLKLFFSDALRGVSFQGDTIAKVERKIIALDTLKSLDRILMLMEILNILSDSDYFILSSQPFTVNIAKKAEKRIDKVCNYINKHYNQPVTLNEISDIASMSPQSFCRFFKATTGKSFIDYINELRIGKACMLLIESEKTISEICYDVGFNNVSNFNRRFQKAKSSTPSEYRRDYLYNAS